jgi:hypothetical protein
LAEEIVEALLETTKKAIGLELTDNEREAEITLPMKILMQLSPEEFVSVNSKIQKDPEFKTYLASRHASVVHFRKFLEQEDPEAVADFKRYVKEKLGGWSHYKKANERIWNWLTHSPAVHDLEILVEESTQKEKFIIEPTDLY